MTKKKLISEVGELRDEFKEVYKQYVIATTGKFDELDEQRMNLEIENIEQRALRRAARLFVLLFFLIFLVFVATVILVVRAVF